MHYIIMVLVVISIEKLIKLTGCEDPSHIIDYIVQSGDLKTDNPPVVD